MKPRTIFYLVILLSSIIHLQSSCVKNHPDPKPKELPPITTEGRNTIGFLLNGEVWLPGGGGIGHPDKDFVLDTFSNLFLVNVYYQSRTNPDDRQDFALRMEWPEHECYSGERTIFSPVNSRVLSDFLLNDNCIRFTILKSYKINILKCDLGQQLLSGTFDIEIENECGDIYEITEGRFDARFRYF